MLRALTQSEDVKRLNSSTLGMISALQGSQEPVNDTARWGTYMLGLGAACLIEGWVGHDPSSEAQYPCKALVDEFLEFCGRACEGCWFSMDDGLRRMMNRVLELEDQRLAEDGWATESFEHSYIYRYREFAFADPAELDGTIYRLPVTPEG